MEEEDIFSPDLFINKSYTQKEFTYGPITIKVTLSETAATDFDLTGQVLWPAAEVLNHYLLSRDRALFQSKVSCELGAGIGVCGLLLARLGAEVVLTDHMELVLELLRTNVENHCKEHSGDNAKCMKLGWGNSEDINQILELYPQGFDILFGSDIVFWSQSIPALFETVGKLLSKKEGSKFILAYKQRSAVTERGIYTLATSCGFEYENITLESFISDEMMLAKFAEIILVVFKRKNINS